MKTEVAADALSYLARMAGGDARRALTALELAVLSTPPDAQGVIRVDLGAARNACPAGSHV